MNKFSTLLMLAILSLCLIAGFWLTKKRHTDKEQGLQHTTYYHNFDRFDSYFDAMHDAVLDIVEKEFNGDAINHIDKLRFSKKTDENYKKDVHLQVFHPNGGAMEWPNKILKEWGTKNSKFVVSLTNQRQLLSPYWLKQLEKINMTEEDLALGALSAIVTDITKEACEKIMAVYSQSEVIHQQPSLTPFPQRPTKDSLVNLNFGERAACLKGNSGQLYYVRFLLDYRFLVLPEYSKISFRRIKWGY